MRLGFAITGIGAACAFAVVSSRSTLALHGSSHEFFASQVHSAGVDLVVRDADEVIRLDQLLDVTEPTQLPGGLQDSVFDKGPSSVEQSWPLPISSLGSSQGFGADLSVMGGGASTGSQHLTQTPPAPPDPPPKDHPWASTGLTSSAPLGSITPPDPGPPIVSPPGSFTPPPDPLPPGPPLPPVSTGPGAPPPTLGPSPTFFAAVSAAPASATPEPSSWVAMLVGAGALGAAFRRRRAQEALRTGILQQVAPARSSSGGEG